MTNKKEYEVEVRELLARTVKVSAINEDEAVGLVKDMYKVSALVLDSNDMVDSAEFELLGESEDAPACGNCGRPSTQTVGDVHRCERCASL